MIWVNPNVTTQMLTKVSLGRQDLLALWAFKTLEYQEQPLSETVIRVWSYHRFRYYDTLLILYSLNHPRLYVWYKSIMYVYKRKCTLCYRNKRTETETETTDSLGILTYWMVTVHDTVKSTRKKISKLSTLGPAYSYCYVWHTLHFPFRQLYHSY